MMLLGIAEVLRLLPVMRHFDVTGSRFNNVNPSTIVSYFNIQSRSKSLALACFEKVFCLTVLTYSLGITRHKADKLLK